MSVEFPSNYKALWPEKLNPELKPELERIGELILKILLFPIYLIGNHLHNMACRAIYPGPVEIGNDYEDVAKLSAKFFRDPDSIKSNLSFAGEGLLSKFGGERIYMEAPDGARLEGAFFQGSKHPEKVVVFSGGNASQWECHHEWLELLKPLGVSVLVFNPRGIGHSEGDRSVEGWDLDFYTGCEYLINEKGIDPENLLPMGFSLGGAISTRGAALIQEKYPDKNIKALNLCSFSDLKKEVAAFLGEPLGTMAEVGMAILGLDMPVKPAWDSLKGRKVAYYRPQDEVIPYRTSLAAAIEHSDEVVQMDPLSGHTAPLEKHDRQSLQNEIRNLLELSKLHFPQVI